MSKDLAKTDDDAKQRFEVCQSKDPFPDIPPALLNSADIADYVRQTGMLFPFVAEADSAKLKSASYEVDFMGELHRVDDDGIYKKIDVVKDEEYRLPKNSISFLFLEAIFRLPDYIAARFNLRIRHVHAGLLLGTGPLVDPGFAGRLLIPLHNLTSDDYLIRGGDGLIWVEFTKLSVNRRWNSACTREGDYRPFPIDHRYLVASQYLESASPRHVAVPASSSIPGEIKKSVKGAEDAEKSAASAKRLVYILFGIGILAIASIVVAVFHLVHDTNKTIIDAGKTLSELRTDQALLTQKLNDVGESVRNSRVEQAALKRQLDELDAKFKDVQKNAVKSSSTP